MSTRIRRARLRRRKLKNRLAHRVQGGLNGEVVSVEPPRRPPHRLRDTLVKLTEGMNHPACQVPAEIEGTVVDRRKPPAKLDKRLLGELGE